MSFTWQGLAFVFRHPRLLPLALAPIALTAAPVAWLLWRVFSWATSLGQRAGGGYLGGLIAGALMLLGLVAAYLVASVTILIASAPFCAALSDRAEALATGRPIPKHGVGKTVSEALRGLAHSLLATLIYFALSLALWLVGLVLGPLAPLTLVPSFLLTAYFFAYGFLNYPLSSRCAGFGEKWLYIGRHRAE